MENKYCKYNAKNWLDDNNVSEQKRKQMFPGSTPSACSNVQGNLATSGNYDQVAYDNQIESYINENGYPCWYYPYLFMQDKMEQLTGQHNSAGYAKPFQIIISLQVKDAPSWVSSLGIQNDQTVTAWIHIRTFNKLISPILTNVDDDRFQDYNSIYCLKPWQHDARLKKIQPKPKDCFQVLTMSCDRQWDAGARIWQITNVQDQILSQKFNSYGGHYVWKVTAKRYRYSFEYGMSTLDEKSSDNPMLGEMGEKGNHQIYENDIVKMYLKANEIITQDKLSIISSEQLQPLIQQDDIQTKVVRYQKKYNQQQICKDAQKQVFDMEINVKQAYNHIDSGGFF